MVVALAILLTCSAAAPARSRRSIGGVGFGFFIDELGKFITADNNYFYKPAAGIIYLIFIGLYLGSRAYQRHRGLNEAERVRNAIELIGEANHGPFKAEYRDQALALLAEVPATHPLRDPLIALAGTSTPRPTRTRPGTGAWPTRSPPATSTGPNATGSARRVRRLRVLGAGLDRHRPRPRPLVRLRTTTPPAPDSGRDSFSHLNFLNWATLVSTAVSSVLVVLGLVRPAARRAPRRLRLADPRAAGLDLRHPRLHLRRVPVRRRLRPRHRRPAADLGPADGAAGAPPGGARPSGRRAGYPRPGGEKPDGGSACSG